MRDADRNRTALERVRARAEELMETGWPVEHMTPMQILIAHEAEGDRNHAAAVEELKPFTLELRVGVEAPTAFDAYTRVAQAIGTLAPKMWESIRMENEEGEDVPYLDPGP